MYFAPFYRLIYRSCGRKVCVGVLSAENRRVLIIGNSNCVFENDMEEYEIIAISKNCDQGLKVIQIHRPGVIVVLNLANVVNLVDFVFNTLDYCPCIHITSPGCFPRLFKPIDNNKVDDYLLQVGVPIINKGFKVLSAALQEYGSNKGCNWSMTKHLYPMLAERFGSTDTAVEKNIRDCIKACKNQKTDLFQQVFSSVREARITNAIFIKYSYQFLFGSK